MLYHMQHSRFQCTDVLSSLYSSCMIIMFGSGQVMGRVLSMVHNAEQTGSEAVMDRIHTTTQAIGHVFTQIVSENTWHRHTIKFHHGYRGIGPYFRQAEERGRHLPAYHVI